MSSRFVVVAAVLGLLLFSRNALTAFSDKLSPKESISLVLQSLIVLLLSLYILANRDSAADEKGGQDRIGSTDEVQSKIMAYIQNHSRSKKHLSLEENLSVRWKMKKNVIGKVQEISEYVLRDFVRYWYYSGELIMSCHVVSCRVIT